MSKTESYEMRVVKRSKINLADYNPRQIDKETRNRLKKGLKKFGLVTPLLVNGSDMTLISGHQRIGVMDELEKYPDNGYELNVSVVYLSKEDEMALNVQMNNTSMMGEFDVTGLTNMIDLGANVSDFGFSESDIDIMFGDNPDIVDFLSDSEEVEKSKEEIQKVRDHRQEMTKEQKEQNSASYYFIVVCASSGEKKELMNKMGVPEYEEFVDSKYLDRLN